MNKKNILILALASLLCGTMEAGSKTKSATATSANASTNNSDAWWSEVLNAATQTPTYQPVAPSIPQLTTQLSSLGTKDLAQVLRGVASKSPNLSKPKASSNATIQSVLTGLYTSLDTLERVINDIVGRQIGKSVPDLHAYLMTRLLNIAGKLE